MEFVIDTNILFSFFKNDSITRRIIIEKQLKLYAPKETFIELTKYKDEICEKSHITKKEFDRISSILSSFVETIPKSKFIKSYEVAFSFLSENTKEDAPFIGLALYLKIPLLSNDKVLKKQNKVKVFSTSDLLKIID